MNENIQQIYKTMKPMIYLARHKIDNSNYVTNLFCLFFKMYETIRRFKPKAADYKSITAYPPLITLTFFFFSISFFFRANPHVGSLSFLS